MHAKLLIIVMAVFFPLSAQFYDTDEQDQPTPVITEDTISDELPAPLPEGTSARPATVTAQVTLVSTTGENFEVAKKLSGVGAALYFVGLGLSRGIALPMAIAVTSQEDIGMALGSAIIDVAATGFKISGATRNGVGAGIAYNVAARRGMKPDRNINWGFYKAGWALLAISSLSGIILNFSGGDMDQATGGTIQLISITTGIASDVMWSVGVINSLKYTRSTQANNTGHSSVSIIPVYSSARKSAGAVATWSF